MSEFDLADGVEPEEQPEPEDYEASEREEVSEDTGTVYDPTGAAETTPQDVSTSGDDDDEDAAGGADA
jgi:hypothetical protein